LFVSKAKSIDFWSCYFTLEHQHTPAEVQVEAQAWLFVCKFFEVTSHTLLLEHLTQLT